MGPTAQVTHSTQQANGFFRLPAPDPAQSLRDETRLTLAARLRDDFKARLNVAPARQGASPDERWKAMQKVTATAYLLGLPVSPFVGRHLHKVEQWTTQEIFGASARQLAGLLQCLQRDALAELGMDRIPPGKVRDEVVEAIRDFKEYVGECIANLGELRRSDGLRPQQLSLDKLARIRFYVASTT